MNRKPPYTQRLGLTLLLTVFLSVQILGFFAFPRQAKATGMPVFDAANFSELVKDGIWDVLTASALGALLNGASYFMRKIAYDTASYIANGGKGQSALVFEKGFGSYLEDVGGNAAATAIDQLGKPFGLDLCKMPSASFQVDLQIGLRQLYAAPGEAGPGVEPSCTWQKLKKGWDTDDIKLKSAIGNAFNATLSVNQSDFGIALSAVEQVDRFVAKQRVEKSAEYTSGNGFKAVTDIISGNIKTPASVVADEAKILGGKQQTELTMQQIAGVYGSGFLQVIPMAGSVFFNTLISQGLNNLFTKGLIPTTPESKGIVDFYAQAMVSNKKSVEQAFNYLFTAVPTKQFGTYPILAELEACYDSPGLNNCIIDTKLREAIDRAKFGKPLTIREAVKEKLLDGNRLLISPLRIDDNTSSECRLDKYCYSNLQKLRKLRVFPIGFELAALKSDPDKPWTLNQVLDGFDTCDPTKKPGQYEPDPKYPFCNLLDPNWIIRLPETRCESEVFGPVLASVNAPERRKECVDMSTCLTEGPNGECIGQQAYGYCTREKNIWRIGGNSCEAAYNTCKTYVDEKGGIRSYLSRTIDYGSCNLQAVGCTAFSFEKDATGWVSTPEINTATKLLGRAQLAFFNKNIGNYSCPSDQEGCSAFYTVKKTEDGTYSKNNLQNGGIIRIKKAPDYLGCYDVDPAAGGIQYPKTPADLAKLAEKNKGTDCAKFASACLPEETACEMYKPTNGGPEVTGIIGANGCKEQCVGYATFKQEGTQFEKEQYPLYFIPKKGEQCSSQEVGCTEFTNLDNEALQHFSKIKYCEKPNGQNVKTFYSWEGNDANGYVLKVHKLRPLTKEDAGYIQLFNNPKLADFSEGTPAYADDRKTEIEKHIEVCNAQLYNDFINNVEGAAKKFDADCRAFYDDAGKVSYRLLDKTITVSESCTALRKTEAEFHVDPFIINNATLCESRGGKSEGNTCMRCTGGGVFKDNSCVYSAVLGEEGSVSCSAEANGCRAYKGNTGNNTSPVIESYFEEEDKNPLDGWSVNGAGAIKISAESIHVGPLSMQVNAAQVERQLPKEVTEDGWYELSFLVRGTPQSLAIDFGPNTDASVTFTEHIQTKAPMAISINNTWRLHTLGPVYLPKGAAKKNLRFITNGNQTYFLDAVELRKIKEDSFLTLIKGSWKTPVIVNGVVVSADAPHECDADPTDTLPGAALGCKAYTDQKGNTTWATGFDQLCRKEAIGCQALVDTFNTINSADEEKAHIYNAECTLAKEVLEETPCTIPGNNKNHTCNVPVGEKTCFVPKIAVEPAELLAYAPYIKASTIVTNADTPISEPVFLTASKQFECNPNFLGCQKVAIQYKNKPTNQSSSFTFDDEKYVMNNPANYFGPGGTLCNETQVGCGEFTIDNGKSYFKDPVLSGNTLCAYKEVKKQGSTYKGWFKIGVGQCANNEDKLCRPDTAEADCGNGIQCVGVDEVQCYDNYLDQNGEFGMWSNKSESYAGFVGVCPQKANQCTELVDPQDTSDKHPKGKPYYVVLDDKVKDKMKQCTGVSLDEGCVLFDKTEDPNKKYSSTLTYKKSAAEFNKMVPPQNATTNDPGNANLILKVDRDRECSEWLSCRSSVSQINDNGKASQLCYDFRACDQLNSDGTCAHWKEAEVGNEYLDLKKYMNRDTSWYGQEYVGYSVPNKYQVTYYDYISVSGTPQLVYKLSEAYFENPELPLEAIACTVNGKARENWSVCGDDQGGRCFNGACVYPIDKPFSKDVSSSTMDLVKEQLGSRSLCKAFPESNSPFPTVVATETNNAKTNDEPLRFLSKNGEYAGANVCQDGDCSCKYVKIEYRSSPLPNYWNADQTTVQENSQGICADGPKKGQSCKVGSEECTQNFTCVPQTISQEAIKGICVGGEQSGKYCKPGDAQNACVTAGGTCESQEIKQTHIGLKGLCIEEDLSRPLYGSLASGKAEYACLTWLPIEVNVSGLDNYNNFQNAGYNPGTDAVMKNSAYGQTYCAQAATGANGPVVDPSMVIPNDAYEKVYKGMQSMITFLSYDAKSVINLFYGGFKSVKWHGTTFCTETKSAPGGDFALEGAKNECENWVEQCIINPSSACAHPIKEPGLKLTQYPFNRWVYSTLSNYTGWKDGSNEKSYAVWFVDNVQYMRNYFSAMANKTDGKGDDDYFDNCDDDGDCHTFYKYYYPIGKLLSGAGNVSSDPYILPSISSTREGMISKVYFSPFVWNMDFSNPHHYDDKYNNFYLDFSKLHDALNTGGTLDKGVVLEPYPMVGAAQTGKSYYTVYQGVKKINNGNTRYLAFAVMQNDIDAQTSKKVIDKYLKEEKPDVATGDGFNYVAVYMDFTPDGKLIMDSLPNDNKPRPFFIKTRIENHTSGDVYKNNILNRQIVASTVVFKPFCTDFRQVYSDVVKNDESTDKAWTNRVWKNAVSAGGSPISKSISRDVHFPAYGSISLAGIEFANSTPDDLFKYVFENKESDGIPQQCETSVISSLPSAHFYKNSSFLDENYCGQLTNVTGYDSSLRKSILNNKSTQAYSGKTFTVIDSLFAKTFLRQERDGDTYKSTKNIDKSGEFVGYAPTIYSLNPHKCLNKDGCVAAEANAFTINERNATQEDYNGDGLPDEDYAKEGFHEALIERGTKAVVARFFAMADDNRMPIRRIMINWDDNTTVTNHETYGRYKNRKPYCGAPSEGIGLCGKPGSPGVKTAIPPSLVTCTMDADCKHLDGSYACLTLSNTDKTKVLPGIIQGYEQHDAFDQLRFGNDPRACKAGYYEYTHSYTCPKSNRVIISQSELSPATKAKLKTFGLDIAKDEVCVYKPGVQILDNWGWCNGSDKEGNPQAKYGKDCDSYTFETSYTPYKGYIVIIPEKQ